MKKIYSDQSYTIGNTPLIRLKKIGHGYIIVKVESQNPGFSVKCRISANMIWNAEKTGILNKKKEILEATSGNTGISLAYIAASHNYKITLTMPETMSLERKKLLKALGAQLILTDGKKGMKGAVLKAKEMDILHPGKYVLLQQFNNPANPEIHEKTTGPEIWNDTDGEIDVLISGVGTGGTITGISRYIKKTKKRKNFISVAVEPDQSPVISQFLSGKKIKPGTHKIQGIGAGFIPKNLDLNLIDKVITVSYQESILASRMLMQKEGILAGISSGAALSAAIKIQKEDIFKNKNIVVILPSSGERYLSTDLFAEI
ncbi:cysteine synthase A [Buchnera aphidicola (Pemphigus obesinymphae)]|uniref:cysteine synthase A n=1 Tax=Buchnera aphidicola TaxID=9 RepID=UPI0022374E35|nr:cysteine synthase A [Buchnera aphidicola]MCW5196527.1 cysteine synthase A [Buchnera aphidicola (Pemphigus obesinymphae)]